MKTTYVEMKKAYKYTYKDASKEIPTNTIAAPTVSDQLSLVFLHKRHRSRDYLICINQNSFNCSRIYQVCVLRRDSQAILRPVNMLMYLKPGTNTDIKPKMGKDSKKKSKNRYTQTHKIGRKWPLSDCVG